MKKLLIVVLVLLAGATGYYFLVDDSTAPEKQFTFTTVTRGNVVSTITSSGVIEPVSKVEVGTQVSGKIAKLYVDFNDRVKKNQLLAVLDTTFLAASVRDARATLSRAKAQLLEAELTHERNQKLYKQKYLSELDYIKSKTALATAKAGVQSATSALERAITNLNYAFIRSPISGTVINRNVEEGQTVAASLQAPTIFTIAEDLSRMRIIAQVDESDIGSIKNGIKVTFTVPAYMDEEFTGKVVQIRLQPETIQNVVNYNVVIEADNDKGLLLPGMTATVDFYIEEKQDVLLVNSSALKFTPPEDMLTEYRERMRERFEAMRDSTRGKRRFNRQQGGAGNSRGGAGSFFGNGNKIKAGTLWYLDEDGNLTATRVILGTSDGKVTEIVRGRNVSEGMKVITKYGEQTKTTKQNSFRPPPPMGGFGRL